jgi:hypothetical protein
MNSSVNGPNQIRNMWRRAQERPGPAALIVLLVTLFIALAGYPLIWLVGGAIVVALLLPSLLNAGATTSGTSASSSPTLASGSGPNLSELRGHYLDFVQQALATRKRIEEAVGQTQDPGQRQVLANAISDLPKLTDSICALAVKAQSVHTGLGDANPMGKLTDEIKSLEASMNSTNDEFQKSQYYSALDGKLQQMQNITDTTVALQRWDAQIENAVSTLDTLLSQVLRIKSSEVLSYTGSTDDLSNSLKREVDSLRATAEAMDNVYGWQKT